MNSITAPVTLAFPLEELLERITPQIRAILISNPNNPTGTGIDLRAIEKILDKAPQSAVPHRLKPITNSAV